MTSLAQARQETVPARGNLLVPAGAGTGRTGVMEGRPLRRITDPADSGPDPDGHLRRGGRGGDEAPHPGPSGPDGAHARWRGTGPRRSSRLSSAPPRSIAPDIIREHVIQSVNRMSEPAGKRLLDPDMVTVHLPKNLHSSSFSPG